MRVLDLFSAAAGGWSLGLHRAGFETVAACEWIAWRRALYAENNPGVPIYDDVRTLTAERLRADLGIVPDVIVGSPPCQDISSANTKGKGVEGERSGLYFEAVRLVGECRPRWFAFENSSNLRSRGADRVLGELEGLGYACWAFVVSAEDLGANHERKRSWIIGCDVEQLAAAPQVGCAPWAGDRQGHGGPVDGGVAGDVVGHGLAGDSASHRCGAGRAGRPAFAAAGLSVQACRNAPEFDADGQGKPNSAQHAEMGRGEGVGGNAAEPWAGWNSGLAGHLRVDDGLSARLASTRVDVGGPRGTTASSLIVEAFGDAVIPQIPEAIGRAIRRVEAAYAALRTDARRASRGAV